MAKSPTKPSFSAEERAAMRARSREFQAEARRNRRSAKADGESDVLARIADMQPPDRALAERIHAIVKATAPELSAKTWYGMPAYARDGKIVCYFKDAAKFKDRYATFGFNDEANLDDGNIWPTVFAVKKLTRADEATIVALIKKAMR